MVGVYVSGSRDTSAVSAVEASARGQSWQVGFCVSDLERDSLVFQYYVFLHIMLRRKVE